MGDHADDALQPSKKRAAGREISRDNPGLDDDEDTPEQELGTFKKASEEVLATRRIVKVRRGPPPPSSTAPPATSSNPFAGIKLVPPTLPKRDPSLEPEPEPQLAPEPAPPEPKPEVGDESEKVNQEEDKTKRPEPEEPPKPVAPEEEVVTEKKGPEEQEKEQELEITPTTTHSLSSFQQLSSSQNAFTNLSGTGFSSSTFSFGPIKSDGFGFAINGAGSSPLFANSSSSSPMTAKLESAAPAPPAAMKEVEVETGEENEEAVFSSDSILYEFTGSVWKERGKGEVKINVSKRSPEEGGGAHKARLVMRAKGNYRLILNASLFPDMKLTAMDKKGLSFACVNCAGEEDTTKFSTFALKFKDPSIVDEFRRAFAAHKGNTPAEAPVIASVGLKTPENSPKASSD